MAKINLLPWRAERRKLREREFYGMLGAAAAAAVVALGLGIFGMNARIDNQSERNGYLQGEIKEVDKKLTEIKELDKTRSKLLARKQVIEQLQADRSQMVHLFDELVKTTTDDMRLTQIKQAGDILTLEGVAQSFASIGTYMRNLEASPWMGIPKLKKAEAKRDEKRMPYVFSLDVKLRKPGDNPDGSPAPDGAAPAPGAAVVPQGAKS